MDFFILMTWKESERNQKKHSYQEDAKLTGRKSCHFRHPLMLSRGDTIVDTIRTFLLPAGSAAGSSAGIVFTHGPILSFFAPQGGRIAPIKVKFGREERTVGPLLSAKFDLDRFRGGGLRPPKLKKIEFYQYNCP